MLIYWVRLTKSKTNHKIKRQQIIGIEFLFLQVRQMKESNLILIILTLKKENQELQRLNIMHGKSTKNQMSSLQVGIISTLNRTHFKI